MSDPTPTVTMVGHPAPEFLRMVALGAGLRGGVVPAIVTFREEFRDEEWAAIEAGDYVAGVKLYRRADALPGVAVAGHELELTEGEYVRTQRRSRKR